MPAARRAPGARLSAWFYGKRPPEHGASTLGHRRVYIVPTRIGLMFAATLVIMLVGSINYVLSLGYMLTFLLAGMGLAGMVHTVRNLARQAREAGVQIFEGVEVTGLDYKGTEVEAVVTSGGTIRCEAVLAAPGLWAPQWWAMQGLDPVVTLGEGDAAEQAPLTEYWLAREGDYVLPGVGLSGNAGRAAPVVHFDHTAPLYSDRDGELITDQPWGIYFRMGMTGGGIVGGGLPLKMDADFAVDPYGPDNPEQVAGDDLSEFFTSGLAFALKRFRGAGEKWDSNPNGGVLALTPDRYPVTDWTAPNVYSILDAGHGFKMLAIGREVARELLGHRPSPLLEPFRLSRFGGGTTHVVSKSPYPWT